MFGRRSFVAVAVVVVVVVAVVAAGVVDAASTCGDHSECPDETFCAVPAKAPVTEVVGTCVTRTSFLEKCPTLLDVVLAVDVSGSINQAEFAKFDKFICATATLVEQSGGSLHYYFFAEKSSRLLPGSSAASVLAELRASPQPAKAARERFDLGSNTATRLLFSQKATHRYLKSDYFPDRTAQPDSKRLVVWLSDIRCTEKGECGDNEHRRAWRDEAESEWNIEMYGLFLWGVTVPAEQYATEKRIRSRRIGDRGFVSRDATRAACAGNTGNCYQDHVFFSTGGVDGFDVDAVLPWMRAKFCWRGLEPAPAPELPPTPPPLPPAAKPEPGCKRQPLQGLVAVDKCAAMAEAQVEPAACSRPPASAFGAAGALPSFNKLMAAFPTMDGGRFRTQCLRGNLGADYLRNDAAMRLTFALRAAGATCLRSSGVGWRKFHQQNGAPVWVGRGEIEKVVAAYTGAAWTEHTINIEKSGATIDVGEREKVFEQFNELFKGKRGIISYSNCFPWSSDSTGSIDLFDGRCREFSPYWRRSGKPAFAASDEAKRFALAAKECAVTKAERDAVDNPNGELMDNRCVQGCPLRHFVSCARYRFFELGEDADDEAAANFVEALDNDASMLDAPADDFASVDADAEFAAVFDSSL